MKRITLLFLALLLTLSGCALPQKAESVNGFYFDTVISITAYGAEPSVLSDALALCGQYEALLSRTRPGSDVWKLNHAEGARVPISEDTWTVLKTAIAYGDLSGGLFDITIAPASALWDFNAETPTPPDAALLAAAAEQVDYRQLDVTDAGARLPSGCAIDLGGIAKGYITDQVAEFLRQSGVEHAFLNFGGNVLTIGAKPDGTPWTVGIQDPNASAGESIAAVKATDASVVTSGIYQRGFSYGGAYYHHLLDSKTGMPIENNVASVTIVTPTSMDGDALSTTCFALGETEGLARVEGLDGVEAVYVLRDGTVLRSSGLPG